MVSSVPKVKVKASDPSRNLNVPPQAQSHSSNVHGSNLNTKGSTTNNKQKDTISKNQMISASYTADLALQKSIFNPFLAKMHMLNHNQFRVTTKRFENSSANFHCEFSNYLIRASCSISSLFNLTAASACRFSPSRSHSFSIIKNWFVSAITLSGTCSNSFSSLTVLASLLPSCSISTNRHTENS